MSTLPNLKRSSSNNNSSRSNSLSSRKRSNDDLTQKLQAKEQEIAKLNSTIKENELTALQQRQQYEDLKRELSTVKFKLEEKSEELERFRYKNHLHRKNLLVQHHGNLDSLQSIISRKDKEIELLKSRLHNIIRSKYTECEDLRNQLDILKGRLSQISTLNSNISDQIRLVKKKSVAFSQPEVVATTSGQSEQETLAEVLTEKLENIADHQCPGSSGQLIAEQSSPRGSVIETDDARSISKLGVLTKSSLDMTGSSSSMAASMSKCNLLILDSNESAMPAAPQDPPNQNSDNIENVTASDELEKDN